MKRQFSAIITGFAISMAMLLTLPTLAQDVMQHPWKGKRVAFLGDSLTDPRNKGSKTKYWTYLQQWLGIEPYVYGRSGWQWIGMLTQADSLSSQHGNDFDAIVIFCGTNDFNDAVPIGQWFSEAPEQVEAARHEPRAIVTRMKRTPVYNDTTLCGRINWALAQMKKRFPQKQIVLLTPIHRAYFNGGEKNVQPTEEYQNACGEYFDRYIETIKQAGQVWAVPVIDVYSKSGLYPVFDETAVYFHDMQKDRLHPNDEGQKRLARTLYYQLATLPCTFD